MASLNIRKVKHEVKDIQITVLEFCVKPGDKEEILRHIGVESTPNNFRKFILELVNSSFIKPVITRSPKSPPQYATTAKGLYYLKSLGQYDGY